MDLGEQPPAEIEPGEPPPGGVDAVQDVGHDAHPIVPDLSGAGNATAKDEVPDELTEPDETDHGAATDGASEPEKEAPA
jgi:hypothetical protein